MTCHVGEWPAGAGAGSRKRTSCSLAIPVDILGAEMVWPKVSETTALGARLRGWRNTATHRVDDVAHLVSGGFEGGARERFSRRGRLSTRRGLIEKGLTACRKTFF